MHPKVSGRRVLAVVALLSTVILAALSLPLALHALDQEQIRRASEPKPIVASPDVQLEIAREIIRDSVNPKGGPTFTTVVLDSTAAFCVPGAAGSDPACSPISLDDSLSSIELDTEVPRKLRMELLLANRSSIVTPDPGVAGAIFKSRERLSRIFSGGDGWTSFHSEFPDAHGYLELSRAVLSRDGKHALMYSAFHCGWLCGLGTLIHLEKTPTGWRVTKSVGLRIS